MWAEPSGDAAYSDAEDHQNFQSDNAHPDCVEKLLFIVRGVAVEVPRGHGVTRHTPRHDGYFCVDRFKFEQSKANKHREATLIAYSVAQTGS